MLVRLHVEYCVQLWSLQAEHETRYGMFWGRKQRWGKGGFRVVLAGRNLRKLVGRWDNMAVTQELALA